MVANNAIKMWGVCLTSFLMLVFSTSVNAQNRPKYRTLDGTLNNLTYPQYGTSNIPFFRELPAEYADGQSAVVTNRPNPRLLSNKLSDEPEDDHNDRYMAGMFYSWGQFLDHDITRRRAGTETMPIPLPSDESKFTAPIAFNRSAAHAGSGITTPRNQTNATTSWVDASQVYGDNLTVANWLRTFSGGKLKVSAGNLLPFNTVTGEYDAAIDPSAPTMDDTRNRTTGQLQKVFVAGDPRASEHPLLSALTNLLVREHNRICETLKTSGLSDEVIYQKARKEVGALMQAVSYGQWISSLGVSLQPYSGYKATARPDIMNTFSTAAYRWHTMVENDIIFRDNSCQGVGPVELPLKDIFFNPNIIRKNGIDVLLKGISVHRSYETDLRVNSGLRNNLLGPGQNSDLVSLNIQRGRDHGLPNYNAVRNFYTGSPALSFTDIAGSSRTSVGSAPFSSSNSQLGELVAPLMQSLYGDVNKVDLWVGLYAEPRLSGKSIGKTVDAILRAQLERLRDGDFYYFENDPELTAADKTRIRSTTLKHIIERNTTARDLQDNVFFVKSCSSTPNEFDDIAKRSCSETPQYEGWTLLGKHASKAYYKWNGADATYDEARALTARLGGNVPQIANAAENTALTGYLKGSTTWLNIGRAGTTWKYPGTFNAADQFLIGANPTYFNWAVGEPNNYGGVEGRVQIRSDGKWNDVPTLALQPVVAEVPCKVDCANDVTPPVFTSCPTNQSVSMGLLSICKPAYWSYPTATDECGSVHVLQTSGFSSGWCLLPGIHNITYTAKDLKGNNSYCSFSINAYKTFGLFLQSSENLAMDAVIEAHKTLVEWVSNTGDKNDFFTLEKRNPTTGEFNTLAIVNNQSIEKEAYHYNTYDVNPDLGDNTYRVKVTFQDGSTKTTNAKTVNFKGVFDIPVYPNPANDVLSLDLTGYKNQAVEIILYNYLGQQQFVNKIDKVENTVVELNVAAQQVGQYMLRVKSKGSKDVVKPVVIAH